MPEPDEKKDYSSIQKEERDAIQYLLDKLREKTEVEVTQKLKEAIDTVDDHKKHSDLEVDSKIKEDKIKEILQLLEENYKNKYTDLFRPQKTPTPKLDFSSDDENVIDKIISSYDKKYKKPDTHEYTEGHSAPEKSEDGNSVTLTFKSQEEAFKFMQDTARQLLEFEVQDKTGKVIAKAKDGQLVNAADKPIKSVDDLFPKPNPTTVHRERVQREREAPESTPRPGSPTAGSTSP